MLNPVGVMIATTTPPEELAELAKTTEMLGFGEVWVAEDYFQYGGLTSAAIVLGATTSITVGLGIVSSVVRHPAVTAQEIATLARTYPGRFMPGIGHGVPSWTGQMGLTPKSPLTSLNECVGSIQKLLAGGSVDLEGSYFTFKDVSLMFPPDEVPPVLTGVLGPKSLQLSGRIADGTVMSVLAGAEYIRSAKENIAIGQAESGRTSHLIPTFALFSVHADSAVARAAVRPALAGYLMAVGSHNALTDAYGYREEIAALLEQGLDHTTANLPEEWIDTLTVAGSPDEVVARIQNLLDAGATSVVLSPVNGATARQELAIVAEQVLPKLIEGSRA